MGFRGLHTSIQMDITGAGKDTASFHQIGLDFRWKKTMTILAETHISYRLVTGDLLVTCETSPTSLSSHVGMCWENRNWAESAKISFKTSANNCDIICAGAG